MISTILLYFAFVFAVIAAIFVVTVTRPSFTAHFGWLAVAFYLLSIIVGGHGFR